MVDEIIYKLRADAKDSHTQSAILGPFFRHDAPLREKGSTITFDTPKDGQVAYMHGRVLDSATGKPLANAEIDIWEASTNGRYSPNASVEVYLFGLGLYEQQDPAQREHNLRGKFRTGDDGEYALYCLRPTPYPVPDDGPAGHLLNLMDRHPFRPAHIHILVSQLQKLRMGPMLTSTQAIREGYKPIVTQIFDQDSKHLEDDSVFAVKDALKVKFEPRKNDEQAEWELNYDILLKPVD